MMRWSAGSAILVCCLILLPSDGSAQLNGNNTRGDFGLLSGYQADPGTYLGAMFFNYAFNDIVNRDGVARSGEEGVNIWAVTPLLTHTTNAKILGANYGFGAAIPFVNSSLEFPRLGVDDSSFGLGDIWLAPIWLGWKTARVDVMTLAAVYLPTGRYEADADDNIGLGHVGYELGLGGNVYFDQQRSVHLATTGFLEFHSSKEGSDTKPGTILTLEGGLGTSLNEGLLVLGASYFAQWKLSDDVIDLPGIDDDVELSGRRHRVYGLGPEITWFVPALRGTLTGRYFWDFGARSTSRGNTFVFLYNFWFNMPEGL